MSCFSLFFPSVWIKILKTVRISDISGGFSLFFYLASCDNQFLIHFLK